MVWTKAISQEKKVWKSEIFSYQNRPKYDFLSGQKKSMCHHLPTTLDDISNKYKVFAK